MVLITFENVLSDEKLFVLVLNRENYSVWTTADILLWLVNVSLFGVGREKKEFGTSFGSFGPLQQVCRDGHLRSVKFIQLSRKLVSA